jgi:GT2 family glycosyltransferase
MVRKADFKAIGGFNSPYWPGEDTKLCLDLIQKTNKKILYIPNMVVWHHRRAGLAAHLKQVGGYGLHRGYFAKKYPETSRKLTYFIPSAFLIFSIISVSAIWLPSTLKILLACGWGIYALAMLFALRDIAKYESFMVAIIALGYVFLTHLFYGLKFIQGLFTSNLVSRLR